MADHPLCSRGMEYGREAPAYGTRDEIIAELRNNLGAQRSERRQQASADAIQAIEAGAPTVRMGKIRYIVLPMQYLVELHAKEREEVSFERIEADGDAEAWKLARDLGGSSRRVTAIYSAIPAR